MTAIRPLARSVAAGAIAFAAPTLAQNGPGPEMTYEYAVPAQGGVIHDSAPVVQAAPSPPMERHNANGPAYQVETGRTIAHPPHHHAAQVPPPMPAPMAHPGHMAQHSYQPYVAPNFNRGDWLSHCRRQVRGVRSSDDRAKVITGLLGAVAGGVAGNRVSPRNRLSGTLIGAGIGGIAGIAVGAAIDGLSRRDRDDECTAYLDHYMRGGFGGPSYAYGYGQPGYGYGYGGTGFNHGYGYNYGYGYGYGAVAYMPVLVAVPQQQVVREYVTEEWIDVPVRTRTITKTKVIRHSAPAPASRTKLIKDKRIRYSK